MPKKTLAILGHRGIPANYGGFETLAEQLSPILAGQGFTVINYCRRYLKRDDLNFYQGSQLVYLPCLKFKSLETLSHTLLATWHLYWHPTDYALVVNVGNAFFALLLKLRGIKVMLNVDGFEWQRKKWGLLARWFFMASSYLAPFSCQALITDSWAIKNFYKTKRHQDSIMIPYGATETEVLDQPEILQAYGLKPKGYFLYLARFEQENNPLLVREAYEKLNIDLPLVMVGDAPYARDYVKKVKATNNLKVKFLGSVYGPTAKVLMANALAYIRASEVGGLSPALIEMMGLGVCIIANENSANRQAMGDDGFFYSLKDDSLLKIMNLIADRPQLAIDMGQRLKIRANKEFNWKSIGQTYVDLIKSL